MKKHILLFFITLSFSFKSTAQEFTPYKVWTSENYYNSEFGIKEINYKDIKFTLSGDFDGNGTSGGR